MTAVRLLEEKKKENKGVRKELVVQADLEIPPLFFCFFFFNKKKGHTHLAADVSSILRRVLRPISTKNHNLIDSIIVIK